METQHNDGGPAFPAPAGVSHITLQGMTLRDWFAGQALAGMERLKGGYASELDLETRSIMARWAAESAYRHADAMLDVRQRKTHE